MVVRLWRERKYTLRPIKCVEFSNDALLKEREIFKTSAYNLLCLHSSKNFYKSYTKDTAQRGSWTADQSVHSGIDLFEGDSISHTPDLPLFIPILNYFDSWNTSQEAIISSIAPYTLSTRTVSRHIITHSCCHFLLSCLSAIVSPMLNPSIASLSGISL